MSYIGIEDHTFDVAFGGRVKNLLQVQKSSVRRLAVLARVRPRRLIRLLAGKSSAGPAEYGRIVQALGVDRTAFDRELLIEAQIAQFTRNVHVQETEANFAKVIG